MRTRSMCRWCRKNCAPRHVYHGGKRRTIRPECEPDLTIRGHIIKVVRTWVSR